MTTSHVETALAPRRESQLAAESEWSVQRIVEQTKKIQECMAAVMKRDEHYGVIPGTGTKPTLLKAGAEKLCLMFRFDPEYEVVTSTETPALFAYTIRCILWHIPTGARVASGLGACNSREDKYIRAAAKRCPQCGKESIIKGREEYGGGWLCFAKKGGCGAKFSDGAEAIEKQDVGIKDPSDLSNTILKMACKRALVAAVLNGTAASDCFTQDLEDLTEKAAEYTPPQASADPRAEPARAPRANTVRHDGAKASPEAVKLLHTLRGKVGGLVVCDKAKPCPYPNGKLCGYHTQLAAFKDQAGKPVTTSKDLAPDQISNLIGRYEKRIAEQQRRAAEDPDLGAAININGNESSRAIADALKRSEMDAQDLCGIFGVDDISELSADAAGMALALVLAYGTPRYEDVLSSVQTRADQ